MYYLLSILFGLIPEVLYFTLFLIYTKDLKEKKIRLFFLITIAYFLCMLIQKYKLIFYISIIVAIYMILKILYKHKVQIIDMFIISLGGLWMTIASAVLFIFLKPDYSNYYLLYVINRLLLFAPFIFHNKFNILYKKYCKLWNRNDKEKRPIKSITLRNISLIVMNFAIVITNMIIVKIIEIGMG